MKYCCVCHRPFSSYYRTNANRIYCYDCWKGERERVLRYRDEAMYKYKQEQQQYQILEERISELEFKIRCEENKREEIKNQYYINQLKEDLKHLYSEKRRIGEYGPKYPRIDNDIMTAKFFESEATEKKYEEQRKADALKEEERKRAEEAERKRIEEERKRKKVEETGSIRIETSGPNDPYFNYVFPGMLETFKSYFQQDFTGIDDKGNVLDGFGMIEYYINKKLVLQVIDYCERGSEVKHCLMLNLCLPDDKIINRLENCIYKDDFKDESAAYYDDDFEKAAKVASYILGAVCGIPKDTKLEYSLESC